MPSFNIISNVNDKNNCVEVRYKEMNGSLFILLNHSIHLLNIMKKITLI